MSKDFLAGCLDKVEYEMPCLMEQPADAKVVCGGTPFDIVTDDAIQTFDIKIIDPDEE